MTNHDTRKSTLNEESSLRKFLAYGPQDANFVGFKRMRKSFDSLFPVFKYSSHFAHFRHSTALGQLIRFQDYYHRMTHILYLLQPSINYGLIHKLGTYPAIIRFQSFGSTPKSRILDPEILCPKFLCP